MAAPTGGGGKFTIIKKKFDPTKTTLREVVEMYIKESKDLGDGKKHRSKFTSQNSPYRPFLDKPVMEFLESSFDDETNPLLKFYDTNKSAGSRRNYYSLAKGIEANVESQIARSTSKELAHFKVDGIPKLTNTVILDPKPGQRALRYAFNHLKAGEFQLALLEHAKKNPKDIPVVRATIAALHLGFRPNEIQKMPATALFPPIEGSVAPGIFISGDFTKMDAAIDIPASSHVHGILTSAIESNKKRFGDLKNVPNLMFLKDDGKPLADGAITDLLKKIKVEGIIQDKQTGKFLDYFTSAYDMRRYNSTIAYKAKFPLQTMAQMKGRAITSIVGAGSEGVYPSPITGLYDLSDLEPHERLSTIIHDQLNKKLNITNENTISSNQDLVGNYTKSTASDNLLEVTPKEAGQAYNVTPQLTDKDFKAPVIAEGQTIEGDFTDVTEKEPPKKFSDLSSETQSKLAEIGITDKGTTGKSTRIQKAKGLKSIDPFAITAGVGSLGAGLDDTGELVAEEVTQSTIAQSLARTAPKLARTAVGRALGPGVAGVVIPTSAPNVEEVEGFARRDIDTRFGGIDQMDTSQEKQIFRDDPRLRGATAMYDPSELPRRDADDPLSDEAYRKRFLEQSRRKASSQLRGFAQPR
tara:strand:- start:45 stop:1958 length:1914 start_codon:yes stop_codon:yes gene_type:complete